MADRLTVAQARRILSADRTVNETTVAAAALIDDMAQAEPDWGRWLAADAAFVAALVLCPSPAVRYIIVAYTALYGIVMWRQRRTAAVLLTTNHPDVAAVDSMPSSAVGAVVLVIYCVPWMVAAVLPTSPIRVVGVLWGLRTLRQLRVVPAAHRQARAVLAAAADTDWFAAWSAQRDQARAAARDRV